MVGRSLETKIKNNSIFLTLLLAVVICLLKKNSYLPMPVVTHPDSRIGFSTRQSVLEQTWQSNVKKISGVSISYIAETGFEGTMYLNVFTDDYSEKVVESAIDVGFQEGEAGSLKFSFSTVRVQPGERYRIQLSYGEMSSEGQIFVDSGSNYRGCNIDGFPCEEGAAFVIEFVKNSRWFWLLAVLFPFLSFSLCMMVCWNRKWEDTVGVALFTVGAVLYVAALTGHLESGIYIVYGLSVLSLIMAILLYNRKKMTVRNLLSPGLFVWIVLFGVILINCRGNYWFGIWDEYKHWGLAVKDMFYYDSLAKHVETTVMLPRYLPFSTLVEYLFVYMNGLFSAEFVYVGFQVMLLSTLSIITSVAARRKLLLLPSVMAMVLLPVNFFGDVYNALFVDPLLAVFFAYVLICYYLKEHSAFNWLRIFGGLFALVVTKDIGAVMGGLLVLIMVGDTLCGWLKEPERKPKELLLKERLPFAGLLLVCVFFVSWQIYMSIPAVEKNRTDTGVETVEADADMEGVGEIKTQSFQGAVSASGITLDGVARLFKGEGEPYQYSSVKNFLILLFDGDSFHLGSISVSYMDLYVLLLLAIGILCLINFWGMEKGNILSFAIFTFIAGLGYCTFLELTYLFAFSQIEALSLASSDRYLGSYIVGVLIAFCFLILKKVSFLERRVSRRGQGIAICLMAIIIIVLPMESLLVKNMDAVITEDEIYGYNMIEEIFRSFSKKGEQVYFICSNGYGSYYIFKEMICPLQTDHGECNIVASKESARRQGKYYESRSEGHRANASIVTIEEWQERLQDCQYVFILHTDDVFREDYGEVFEEPETVSDGSFYEVVRTDEREKKREGIQLRYIGKTGVKTYK